MGIHKIMDASVPPPVSPPGVAGVMGYIGGPTPHVWTVAEWRRFGHLRQFPVWVASIRADPRTQALAAAAAMKRLGWAAFQPEPIRRVLAVDLETSADAGWYARFAAALASEGFWAVAYGSLSTVLENAAADVIAADWDNSPAIPAGQVIHGVQYLANMSYGGTRVDYSVVDDWLFARAGVGPRHE